MAKVKLPGNVSKPVVFSVLLVLLACLLTLAESCSCPTCNQSSASARCQCCVHRQLGKRNYLSYQSSDNNAISQPNFAPGMVKRKSEMIEELLESRPLPNFANSKRTLSPLSESKLLQNLPLLNKFGQDGGVGTSGNELPVHDSITEYDSGNDVTDLAKELPDSAVLELFKFALKDYVNRRQGPYTNAQLEGLENGL